MRKNLKSKRCASRRLEDNERRKGLSRFNEDRRSKSQAASIHPHIMGLQLHHDITLLSKRSQSTETPGSNGGPLETTVAVGCSNRFCSLCFKTSGCLVVSWRNDHSLQQPMDAPLMGIIGGPPGSRTCIPDAVANGRENCFFNSTRRKSRRQQCNLKRFLSLNSAIGLSTFSIYLVAVHLPTSFGPILYM